MVLLASGNGSRTHLNRTCSHTPSGNSRNGKMNSKPNCTLRQRRSRWWINYKGKSASSTRHCPCSVSLIHSTSSMSNVVSVCATGRQKSKKTRKSKWVMMRPLDRCLSQWVSDWENELSERVRNGVEWASEKWSWVTEWENELRERVRKKLSERVKKMSWVRDRKWAKSASEKMN